jgi:glyoxylase-like metal-dependent hydrolase (beta-lactamase superfamily II)
MLSMLRKSVLLLLAAAAAWTPVAFGQDAKTVLSNASKAMGADSVKTLQYSGTATEYSFGQAYDAHSPWPPLVDKSYTRTVNYETPAWRVDRVIADVPADRRGGGFGGGVPPGPTQSFVVGPNTPWAQQLDLWMTPFGFLRAAAKATDATVESKAMGGRTYTEVTFTAPNKAKMNGYFNANNMLDRVETWVANPMLGDTMVEAIYVGYKDFGGVKFPTKIVVKQGGYATLDFNVTDVKPNAPADIQRNPGGGQPAAAVTSRKLADGVYLILPAYAALAVDFKDYIVVIEAPQSEERAAAIIAEAKKDIPDKPIKYVINTHNHFDHASGLRTFIAEGATIVTWRGNKAYYERVFAQPHTLSPDREETEKKKITIETVGEKKVLTDGSESIELYRVHGTYHNAGLLMAYLPKDKILVEADLFNPVDAPGAPKPTPLVENIKRLNLDVQTIVPIHYPPDGRTVTIADLMSAVGGK